MFSRILVPLDGSKFASRALDVAFEVAEYFSAELILVRVIHPVKTPLIAAGTYSETISAQSAELAMEIALKDEARRKKQAERYLKRKVRTVCQTVPISWEVATGQPGKEIIKLAKKRKVDLIIMSAHGTGGIKRAILGSVADEVSRKSGKSVMIIHPRQR